MLGSPHYLDSVIARDFAPRLGIDAVSDGIGKSIIGCWRSVWTLAQQRRDRRRSQMRSEHSGGVGLGERNCQLVSLHCSTFDPLGPQLSGRR